MLPKRNQVTADPISGASFFCAYVRMVNKVAGMADGSLKIFSTNSDGFKLLPNSVHLCSCVHHFVQDCSSFLKLCIEIGSSVMIAFFLSCS